MKFKVMGATKPDDVEWLKIIVVMRFGVNGTALVARKTLQDTS